MFVLFTSYTFITGHFQIYLSGKLKNVLVTSVKKISKQNQYQSKNFSCKYTLKPNVKNKITNNLIYNNLCNKPYFVIVLGVITLDIIK